jgi:hypothetical protein
MGTGGKECGRKMNDKQFELQAKGEDGRQGERETRCVTGKENDKQFERQAKGEDGRQWERETRSVTGKGNGKQFERQVKGTGWQTRGNGRQGVWQERELKCRRRDSQG